MTSQPDLAAILAEDAPVLRDDVAAEAARLNALHGERPAAELIALIATT